MSKIEELSYEIQDMINLKLKGMSFEKIGIKYNVSGRTIHRLFKKNNLNTSYKLSMYEQDIIKEYLTHYNATIIAKKYKVSTATITKMLNKEGIKTDSKLSNYYEDIIEMRNNGKTFKEIGKKYNMKRCAVANFLHKNKKHVKRKNDYSNKIKDGYVFIYKPEHPRANHVGYVKRSHLIWEENTGIVMYKHEKVIHHIDGNKNNDVFDNLLMLTPSEHQKLHRGTLTLQKLTNAMVLKNKLHHKQKIRKQKQTKIKRYPRKEAA